MPGRCNLRVLLPQLDGQLRVTFQGDAQAVLRQIEQGEHLPGHFKHKDRVIEREAFGSTWFGNTVFADLFDVHYAQFNHAI